MGTKFTFDPTNKIIQATQVPVSNESFANVQVDLYSDMKEDWRSDPNLTKFRPPISTIGGQPAGDDAAGDLYFLDSAWKIRPYESSHRFVLTGDLFSIDSTTVFTNTVGTFQINTELVLSTLVRKTSVAGGGGDGLTAEQALQLEQVHGQVARQLWVDEALVAPAIANGYQQTPYNVLNDIIDDAEANGITTINTYSDLQLNRDLKNIKLKGIGDVTLDANTYDLTGSKLWNMSLEGLSTGAFIIQQSRILAGAGLQGTAELCVFRGDCILTGNLEIINGVSGLEGSGYMSLDTNGFILQVTNWTRSLGIKGMTSQIHTIHMQGGQLHLDAGCTGGVIFLRGNYSLPPVNLGTTSIIDQTEATVSNTTAQDILDISSAVWAESVRELTASGSTVITEQDKDDITQKIWAYIKQ